eukprot:SM000109S14137  [mRNA]  locus=s109:79435:85572:- [translate_table: standard]
MRAVVDTEGDQATDTFYVTDATGGKLLSPADIRLVESRLQDLSNCISADIGGPARRPGRVFEGLEGEELGRKALVHQLKDTYIRNDVLSVQEAIVNHVEYTLARSRYNFDSYEAYQAVAHSVRDRLIESWNDTEQHFRQVDPKRIYYLSMEFLMGRSLLNSLYNLNVKNLYTEALTQLGYNLETIVEQERDAALGNGGLGRLAACFLDSLASLNYPAWGYGIRYQYGMFRQTLENGFQHEQPDYWLTVGNPWEIERTNVSYHVKFYGHVEPYTDDQNRQRYSWVAGEQIEAVAYDNPIPGYGTGNTINLRLWAGRPSTEFDLQSFNTGDYVAAILTKQRAETISSVLYPDDRTYQGKELRLKQQFFMVSASLQDIIRRFKEKEIELTRLPEKASSAGHLQAMSRSCLAHLEVKRSHYLLFSMQVALQLNDTHPTIGVAELMRLLMDEEGLGWTKSWAIVQKVFAFTNHTVLPEALEKWPVSLVETILPRHMQIIYQINFNFLQQIKGMVNDDFSKMSRMSIIEEGEVKDFYGIWPHKFQNKTNGVTQRRWLAFCNPGLRDLITSVVGSDAWITDISLVSALKSKAADSSFQEKWHQVKQQNKAKLAKLIEKLCHVKVDTAALFDIQVKRIHEYKRQLLNILSVIHRYEQIKAMNNEQRKGVVPRVIVIGGKAAPGYEMAKRIIKLVSAVGDVINTDTDIGDLLKVFFLPDYNVSLAETIIPASDLSQHISTAGTEASGTSNMKFSMNGGLIIGTMDGANVEICEEIGAENMFIFGVLAQDVPRLRSERRNLRPDPRFAAILESIRTGKFGWADYLHPIVEALDGEAGGDFYLLANDFASYLDAQARVDEAWRDQTKWTQMSILSTANCAKFSSDRTIRQYAEEIWHAKPSRLAAERPRPAALSSEAAAVV